MVKIVISYRRTDSDATGRIFDRLVQTYGRNSIFRDIDSTPVGSDFRKVIGDALLGADILIAVVGPNWRGISEDGHVRLNDANDLVRIEVETALHRNIPVIPVLVGNAGMPKPSELPETLRSFAYCHAASIDSGRNFDADIERLLRSMAFSLKNKHSATEPHPTGPKWLQDLRPIIPRAMLVLGVGTFAVNWLLQQLQGGRDNWPAIAGSIASLGAILAILGFLQYVRESLGKPTGANEDPAILAQLVGIFLITSAIPTIWLSLSLNLEDVTWAIFGIAKLYAGYRLVSANDWSRYLGIIVLVIGAYLAGLPTFIVSSQPGESFAWYVYVLRFAQSVVVWVIPIAAIVALLLPPGMQERTTSRFGWFCFGVFIAASPLIGLADLIEQSKEEYHPDWLADLIVFGLQAVIAVYSYQWFRDLMITVHQRQKALKDPADIRTRARAE
jgi:hypothetical protein